ncbi:MAG: serine hydrolase [Caldilineaceae bacterium]|nr:serine hydrolase [Caldilineaceae bacterium]
MAKDLLAHNEVASNLELFTAWAEAQLAQREQPGMSVGIIYDQRLIWSRGFGYAKEATQAPATPTTLYRIASITKLFTSTAIMQLRDAGLLQLDDPVQKHLPWFTMQNPYPDTPVLTIRHLLTHAGGLPREAAFPYWSTNEFPTSAEIQATVAEQAFAIPTASDWKYSNLGLALAGDIVAAVAAMPYPAYVTENILQPLGMVNTFVDTVPPDHPLLATGYGRRLPRAQRALGLHTDCRGIGPAANMASNVEDLAKFVMLQFRGGPRQEKQILAGSSLREMHRIQWLNDDWSAGRGIGFYVWRLHGRTVVGHGGALMGYRTELQFAPADKIGVVVLTNADDGWPLLYVDKLFQWVVPALLQAAAPKPKVSLAPAAWQPYIGRYRSAWGDLQILLYQGELVLIVPGEPDPSVGMTRLKPVAEHTFRIESKEHFGSNGELAVFEVDEAGRVVRLRLGNTYTEPIDHW